MLTISMLLILKITLNCSGQNSNNNYCRNNFGTINNKYSSRNNNENNANNRELIVIMLAIRD